METEDKFIIAGSLIHLLSVAWQILMTLTALIIGTFSIVNVLCLVSVLLCASVWTFIFREKIPEYKKMFHNIMSKLINDAYKEIKDARKTKSS